MKDLTMTEAVLEWASAQASRWERGDGRTDAETAAYLAQCVSYYEGMKNRGYAERIYENERLRQAFDAISSSKHLQGYVHLQALRDAIKGGDK